MQSNSRDAKNQVVSSGGRKAAGAVVILFVLLHFLISSASAEPESKSAILTDIAAKVISPGYTDLDLKCRALTNAIGQLTAAPTEPSLEAARQAWSAAAAAANRIRCFQAGPIADREYVATFYYSKVRGSKIESTIREASTINQAYLNDQGADVKGLFTLEFLLFGQPHEQPGEPKATQTALEFLTGTNAQHRVEYLTLVAHDVEAKAAQLAADWAATGDRSAQGKFAHGGQQSINILVNQLAAGLESAMENRLHFPLDLPNPLAGQLYRIEGSASGSSLQNFLATMEGIQRIYLGAGGSGLGDAVKPINPALDKKLRAQFSTAMEASRAIRLPLEQAVVSDRAAIQRASDQMKPLEILFKVDMTSALGVTLTFNSTDGD